MTSVCDPLAIDSWVWSGTPSHPERLIITPLSLPVGAIALGLVDRGGEIFGIRTISVDVIATALPHWLADAQAKNFIVEDLRSIRGKAVMKAAGENRPH